MRIISRKTLKEFWEIHPDCIEPLRTWYRETGKAHWKGPADIRGQYASVSLLKNNRAVFDIKGNHYRIVVRINYEFGIVWIRFIGTHAEYDRIDANNI